MQTIVPQGWYFLTEQPIDINSDRLRLFLLFTDPSSCTERKNRINMWYWDQENTVFQFVNIHGMVFIASLSNRHPRITNEVLQNFFTIRHARRMLKPPQLRKQESQKQESQKQESPEQGMHDPVPMEM